MIREIEQLYRRTRSSS